MPAYLDAGFLLTTLIPATGSLVANRILRDGHAPIMLNFLHQIQAQFLSFDPRARDVGRMAGMKVFPEKLWESTGHDPLAPGPEGRVPWRRATSTGTGRARLRRALTCPAARDSRARRSCPTGSDRDAP
jgi:hypothetical protein